MAALAGDRNTPERSTRIVEFSAAAGAVIFRGAMVAIDATALLHPAGSATNLVTVGRAETGTADLGSAPTLNQGALPTGGLVTAGQGTRIQVKRGCFAFANSAAAPDLLAQTDYGATVYAVDDQTVAKTSNSGTRAVAGICRGVDTAGVWVEI